jgi:TolA-binding protein
MSPVFQRLIVFALILLPLPVLAQTPDEQIAAASALLDAKRYADAATKLDMFLAANAKHPKAGLAAYALGRARTELKQWDKAAGAYEKAIASGNEDIEPKARLGLGEAAMQLKDHEKAIAALNSAVRFQLSKEQMGTAYLWIAQANAELERWPEAETAFQRVLRDFDRGDLVEEALYGAGVVAQKSGKKDLARRRFQAVIERFKEGGLRLYARFSLAEMDLADQKYDQARVGYQAVVDDKNAAADAPELAAAAEDGLIRVLLDSGDLAAAAPRLETAAKRLPATDPQKFKAYLTLGNCRYRQKEYPAALTAYTEASKATDPAVAAEALYWAGNAALAAEQFAEAAANFGKMVTRFPQSPLAAKAQLKAGDALASSKQTDAAATAYRAVVAKYPGTPQATDAKNALQGLVAAIDDPVKLAAALKTASPAEKPAIALKLARVHIAQRRFAAAVLPLDDLIKSKPDDAVAADANYLLGIAQDGQEKSQQAVAALAEAVRLAPSAPWAGDAQVRLAWSYIELKQPTKAEAAADAALATKLETDLAEQAKLAKLQATLDQEKWETVLSSAKSVLDSKPSGDTAATALYAAAWASDKLNKPDEAIAFYDTLAKDQPKSRQAAEANLRVANALVKADKKDDARARYALIAKDFPTSPLVWEARFQLGSLLYEAKSYAEAVGEFDAVANEKSSAALQPEALYWAGVAQDKAGNKEAAITRLSKLVTQFPTHMRVANAKVRLAALKAVANP